MTSAATHSFHVRPDEPQHMLGLSNENTHKHSESHWQSSCVCACESVFVYIRSRERCCWLKHNQESDIPSLPRTSLTPSCLFLSSHNPSKSQCPFTGRGQEAAAGYSHDHHLFTTSTRPCAVCRSEVEERCSSKPVVIGILSTEEHSFKLQMRPLHLFPINKVKRNRKLWRFKELKEKFHLIKH